VPRQMQSRIGFLCPQKVTRSSQQSAANTRIVIQEQANDGKAEIAVVLSPNVEALAIDVSHKTGFDIIRVQKNCDGAVVIRDNATGEWSASVVEIKQKVTLKVLRHAREQLEAGAVRLAMVMSFLGIEATRWTGVLVYATDAFSADKSADPVRLHRTVGGRPDGDGATPISIPNLPAVLDFRLKQAQVASDGTIRGDLELP
jgi:hypothetical protein